MNITCSYDKPENGKAVISLTIDKKEVDKAIAQSYREIAAKYNFQGFRRGRAPRPVIDGIVGREAVLAEATNNLLGAVEPEMLETLDLVPLTRLDYGEDVALLTEKSDYSIEITCDIAPVGELDSYEAPSIQMPPEEVTEAEIDRQIEILRGYRTTLEDIEEDRGIEDGDFVLADVENIANMREYEGENRMFNMANPSMPEQLKDGFMGMKVGDEKEIRWTRSHEHDGESHEVEIGAKVKVTAIRRSVTPEITEDNVKTDYGFESIAELRDAVKEEVAEDKKRRLPQLKQDRVVEAIGEHLVIDEVPESYVIPIMNETANQMLQSLQSQGMSLDMYLRMNDMTAETFRDDLRAQAEDSARQSLALDALAAHLELEATDEDCREQLEIAGVPDVDEQFDAFKAEGRIPALREAVRRTKAIEWLVDNCPVTEVDEIAEQAAAEEE